MTHSAWNADRDYTFAPSYYLVLDTEIESLYAINTRDFQIFDIFIYFT
jgi:hypothetical protein